MWCPKALFLPHKYLDIILCYTVCQAILPTALFLFLPIYIMSEKPMRGRGILVLLSPRSKSTANTQP